jgi:hypothetical protein
MAMCLTREFTFASVDTMVVCCGTVVSDHSIESTKEIAWSAQLHRTPRCYWVTLADGRSDSLFVRYKAPSVILSCSHA